VFKLKTHDKITKKAPQLIKYVILVLFVVILCDNAPNSMHEIIRFVMSSATIKNFLSKDNAFDKSGATITNKICSNGTKIRGSVVIAYFVLPVLTKIIIIASKIATIDKHSTIIITQQFSLCNDFNTFYLKLQHITLFEFPHFFV
jgi:hypothetical protein